MNDFFSNLVDRHLGTCETIQPRAAGRFETTPNNLENNLIGSDDTMADINGHNQSLQSNDGAETYEPSEVSDRKQYPVDRRDDISPRPPADKYQDTTSTHSSYREKRLDTDMSPSISQEKNLLDRDVKIDTNTTIKKNKKARSSHLEREEVNNSRAKNNRDPSDKVVRNDKPLPKTSNSEQIVDSTLNHRIQAMIKHLTKDIPSTEPSVNQRDQQSKNNNENPMSMLPNTVIPSFHNPETDQTMSERNEHKKDSDYRVDHSYETNNRPVYPTAASQELPSVTGRKVIQEEKALPENKINHTDQSQLEPPSWLADLKNKLTQRLQDAEKKPDPVINVTIGRVEVRAVQTDTQKIKQQTKKPTGVMTLDDYLKRREGRKTK